LLAWASALPPKSSRLCASRPSSCLEPRQPPSSYALVGVSAGYLVNKNLRIRAGINNVFDKKLYRTGLNYGTSNSLILGAGASTYNEHGRSFFVSVTSSF
ncbi:TonB-dependent receptor, partial [Paracandidimonas soli]|uniref:TonB-dependent receptor n=1 Tax=Paracandidimonas soli TaxID=1917182 RepID=UPI001A9DFEC5